MALIVDTQIDALRSVLQARLNGNASFLANFRETLQIADSDLLIVNTTYPCDPFTVEGFADAVASGNSAFPILGMWRDADAWEQETLEWDGDGATCQFKYILPASPYADRVWPILREFVRQMRIYFQAIDPAYPVSATSRYHAEREADITTFRNAGLIPTRADLAPTITARYGYDGPDRQTLYPVAVGSFPFKCREEWDPDLTDFISFEGQLNLKGDGSDGDLPPPINPLVTMRAPPGP